MTIEVWGDSPGSYLATWAGAVTRPVPSKLGDFVSPMDAGAVGDGTANDTAAVLAALQSGYPVDGGGRTYAVSGSVQPSSFKGLRNCTLKQLAPTLTNCRTLFIRNLSNWFIDNLKVDCGGSQTAGTIADWGGVWIDSSAGTTKQFWLRNVEVYNGGPINGIALHSCTEFKLTDCVARDFVYNLSPDPTDDVINGIWLNNCSHFTVTGSGAKSLTGNLLGAPSARWTRGLTLSGCSKGTINGPLVEYVDQGIDFTGTVGNSEIALNGPVVKNIGSWGVKFANSGHHCTVSNGMASDCGLGGYIVQGMTEGANPLVRDIVFSNCIALNTGSSGIWAASVKTGFSVTAPAAVDITYPRGIKFYNCHTLDTQGTPTTSRGFTNEVVAISPTTAGYDKDDLNQIINCHSRGFTAANFQVGFHFDVVSVTGTTTQNIATSTWSAVDFNAENFDTSALHSTSTNVELIYFKVAGYYKVSAVVSFAANATGYRSARFLFNGASVLAGIDEQLGNATIATLCRLDAEVFVNSGEYLRVEGWQNSGAGLNVDRTLSHFKAVRVA